MEAAQTTEPAPPKTDVYIVQPGDTLFAIAQRFGISVDLLAAVNNIDDPAFLSIGQRLLIPPPSAPPLPSFRHVVEPGETLRAISLRFGLSMLEIARANHLIRADNLFVGESLTLLGHTAAPPPPSGTAHTVRPGETLVGLALRYQAMPWSLALANGLDSPFLIGPRTRLWLPAAEGAFLDWSSPFAAFSLHPLPAIQGQTLSVRVSLTPPVSLTASLGETPVRFYQDRDQATALIGIDALAEPGLYTLAITATSRTDDLASLTQRIPVTAGDYPAESIVVPEAIAAAMTADVVQSETRQLEEIFSTQTPAALWDGFFALPASGDITSAFGTRRSYNIPNASAYHTGTDFGRTEGAPVYAPAAGIVVFSGELIVRGNAIILDHGQGVLSGYWHLSARHVAAGDQVSLGQHIGDIGSTGLSTGPHLHWEVRVSSVPVDGMQWVRERFP